MNNREELINIYAGHRTSAERRVQHLRRGVCDPVRQGIQGLLPHQFRLFRRCGLSGRRPEQLTEKQRGRTWRPR